jgi:hypothetical protein
MSQTTVEQWMHFHKECSISHLSTSELEKCCEHSALVGVPTTEMLQTGHSHGCARFRMPHRSDHARLNGEAVSTECYSRK